jgi:hypothetical protein
LNACNDFYFDSKANIYEHLNKNDIIKEKAKLYLILEDIWIIKLLFNKYIIQSYDKKYMTTKKILPILLYIIKKSNKNLKTSNMMRIKAKSCKLSFTLCKVLIF